ARRCRRLAVRRLGRCLRRLLHLFGLADVKGPRRPCGEAPLWLLDHILSTGVCGGRDRSTSLDIVRLRAWNSYGTTTTEGYFVHPSEMNKPCSMPTTRCGSSGSKRNS